MAEPHPGAVSIVGLSFRLPMADDLAAMEAVLGEGRRASGPVPAGRFRADLPDYEALRATERPSAFFGAFLPDVERFDAKRFGIPASDAPKIDPRQRLLLEETAAALADAGSGPGNRRTGVFIGASNDDYALSLGRDPTQSDLATILGNSLGMLASRVSHALDLGGPSVVVDTACSSALVAVHQARQALLRGDCDLAVVGAINLILSPHLHLAFSRARMLSDRGQLSPFDEAADGYVRAEAVVVFVLARTSDALRDGRPGYGDIAGSATNQDGHTRPIVTPSPAAQAEVIRAALADAGVLPGDLSYVEAHGTGTRVGDRVEYAALAEVLRGRSSPCAVGTAKATFGHAEPASGAVGLLQVLAALRRGALPALPGHGALARGIVAEPSLIHLPQTPIPWTGRRLAGVSAFGIGGTNAHVIVAAPALARRDPPLPRPEGDSGQRFWKPPAPPPARLPIAAKADEATILADLRARFTAATGLPEAPAPDQPLLELGVDSLELMSLARGIEARYRVPLSLETLLQPGFALQDLLPHLQPAPEPEPAPAPETPRQKPPTPSRPQAPQATRAFAPHTSDLPSHHPATDAIVAAFTAKTPGSKALAATHRPNLADNRNSAGFRPRTQAMTYPIVADRAAGPRVWDVDGNEYIDASMGFGVHLFGHSPPFITEAVQEALSRGAPLGPQSPVAGEVAALMAELTGLDRFTFTNSGTEAVMLACRLARAATGRQTIVVFEGAYHGTFDGVLGHGGGTDEGAAPMAPGTTGGMVADLMVLPWAHADALVAIEGLGDRLAAVLVEPVQSRRPGVQPAAFLAALREITDRLGAALVFDEVITGFRCAVGGAQALFGVRADLAVYGKIVGGGLPIGVVGGTARFLDRVDGGAWKEGDGRGPRSDLVFFAGTFCKHPLTMAAARATLRELRRDGERLLAELSARTAALAARLNARLNDEGLALEVVAFASLFRLQSPRNTELFFAALNTAGVYVWEGRTMFLSAAHGDAEVALIEERVLAAARLTLGPESWPLSPSQARFLEGGRCHRWGNVGFAVRIDGAVDPERLRAAITATSLRHEVLSARFSDDRATQRFVGAPRVDYRAVAVPEGELGAALAAMADHTFDPGDGPLLILRWFDQGEGGVLGGLTHGVVLDGQSVGLLLEEVLGRYVVSSQEGRRSRKARGDRGGPEVTANRRKGRPGPRATARPGDDLSCLPWFLPSLGVLFKRRFEPAILPPGPRFSHRPVRPQALQAATALLPQGLPADPHQRPDPRPDWRADRVHRTTTPLEYRQIGAARSGSTTLFAWLFAAFAEALGDWPGGRPFAVAVPVTDRREAGREGIIGNLTHLVAVPLGPVGEPRAAVAARVGRSVAASPVPLAAVLEALQAAGRPAVAPRVLFNLEPLRRLPAAPGLRFTEVDFPRPEARFDVAVHVLDTGEALRIDVDYRLDRAGRAAVEALVERLIALAGEAR